MGHHFTPTVDRTQPHHTPGSGRQRVRMLSDAMVLTFVGYVRACSANDFSDTRHTRPNTPIVMT